MAECTNPDCVEARRQRDAYRNAGPALVKAIVIALALASVEMPDFKPSEITLLVYVLLNEPRVGNVGPEDIEVQNLAKIKIDALLNGGNPDVRSDPV